MAGILVGTILGIMITTICGAIPIIVTTMLTGVEAAVLEVITTTQALSIWIVAT